MCFYLKGCAEVTLTEYLHLLFAVDETSLTQFGKTYLLIATVFGKLLKGRKVNCKVLLVIDVLESSLRNTTLQRHLTAFETYLSAVART